MANWTARELIRAYGEGTLSPTEAVAESLRLIDKLDPDLNIFLAVNKEGALQAAEAAEKRVKSGEKNPLLGLPLCIPDVVNFPPFPTTYGSKLFEDNIPAECAPELKKLLAQGVVILGKTNLSEFGLDPETRNAIRGPTRNPLDPQLSSGGPNGGSAAAVAAGICPVALSTDYSGSIRISSSFCKQVGFVPSHGLMPITPAHYVPTTELRLLRKGFIARNVEDIEMLFQLMTGKQAAGDEGPFRIAFSPDLGFISVDGEVAAHLDAVVEKLRKAGHTVELVQPVFDESLLAHFQNIVSVDRSLIIQGALDRHPERYALLTDCTKRWMEHAAGVTGVSYAYAETYMSWTKDRLNEAIGGFDFLLTGVSPVPPYPVGVLPKLVSNTLVDMWGFTAPFNMSGHPVVSLSGVQLIGKAGDDARLLAAARTLRL